MRHRSVRCVISAGPPLVMCDCGLTGNKGFLPCVLIDATAKAVLQKLCTKVIIHANKCRQRPSRCFACRCVRVRHRQTSPSASKNFPFSLWPCVVVFLPLPSSDLCVRVRIRVTACGRSDTQPAQRRDRRAASQHVRNKAEGKGGLIVQPAQPCRLTPRSNDSHQRDKQLLWKRPPCLTPCMVLTRHDVAGARRAQRRGVARSARRPPAGFLEPPVSRTQNTRRTQTQLPAS